MEKWHGMDPNGTLEVFFLLIQTLPTFWAERIWILRFVFLLICWIPNFCISRSPDLQTPAPAPDELSDPNLTPLPTHPGIKYVARALAATYFPTPGG